MALSVRSRRDRGGEGPLDGTLSTAFGRCLAVHDHQINHPTKGTTMQTSKPPTGTKAAGSRLWKSVADVYDLDEHETAVLRSAVATVDLIDVLQAEIVARGAVVESPQGCKANPAVVEIRQQRLVLARLIAALRLPQGEAGDHQAGARPQRRLGVRGVNSLRGVS